MLHTSLCLQPCGMCKLLQPMNAHQWGFSFGFCHAYRGSALCLLWVRDPWITTRTEPIASLSSNNPHARVDITPSLSFEHTKRARNKEETSDERPSLVYRV